ncbi:peptidylprolyl isomerase [Yeosuana sp. MJ-SS3]|uniref:Periplasmic chaperone PpiD n=1 Tax=Gilvirhabdus luticola TaxID=3079858 RepID=A0ABU3U432_9FLAO|nr:peptidylprolyl isomerase [Yeosuana sp. MJ-SS3]MDU8885172.1 peptidylprolyl isomerase [Yeosuana sp. MJ-SS3]
MAVLNKIRQRGLFLIIIIALALFSFVLSDLFRNSDALTSKSLNIVGTINDKDITREYFLSKVEITQRQLGPNTSNNQVMNRVWDQEVRQAVFESQFEKLGISIEKDQMKDILSKSLATNTDFQNEVGLFDENIMNEYIANLKETPAAYQQWVDYENSLAANALQQDYMNLVKAGLMGTLAEGKLEHQLEGNKVDIKYVQIPYTSIPDSTVTISKSDISNYIKRHSKDYEVEESRNLHYVEFKEVASVEDENAIKADLELLLEDRLVYNEVTKTNDTVVGFRKTQDNEAFINSHSDVKFVDRFVTKSNLPTAVADSIYNLNVGEIYGPYKDGQTFKLTKIIAEKQLPDSVKVRHILIPFVGAASAAPDVTQTEAEAKVTADSVLAVVKSNPSKFPELVEALSSDQGSKANGGRYDWHPYNTMVPEFRDFEFEGKTGDIGVVKTAFGFHIIEIEGQKNKQRMIKVGTISREIEPSEATIDKVFRDASNFEIAVANKDFQEVATENNYALRPVNSIKILDESIPGLGNQRSIVRWTFEDATKVGDVKRFNIPGGYAIVQLTAKNKKGLMNVEDATATVLPKLRKEKKAQIIRERVKATSIEDLAAAENTTVKTAAAINMKNPTLSGAGKEGLVVGTAFGLKEGETSKLIDGDKGVYMLQVTKITPVVELDSYQAAANRVGQQKISTVNSKLYNALKEASEIEDNRAKTVQ